MLKFQRSFFVLGDKKLAIVIMRSVTTPIGNRKIIDTNAQVKDCSGEEDTGALLNIAILMRKIIA
jgi:hypothetical protein